MSRRTATIPTGYFDKLYSEDADPWSFRSSPYERDKYADTLSMLEREHYDQALEVGCSIGVLTCMLASRCNHLIGTEPSARARAVAEGSVADLTNVLLGSWTLPSEMPPGRFQLIVLSEVLYYLAPVEAKEAVRLCCDRLDRDGEIVLCHWLGETDYPLSGDEAAEIFLAETAARGWTARTRRRPMYRLDHIRAPRPASTL